MMAIALISTLAVIGLGILAVVDGVTAPRPEGGTKRSKSALLGVPLGVVELIAVATVVAIGVVWSVS